MIVNFISCIFVLLCTALFESGILSNIIILPAVPDFSLICLLFFSFNNGKIMGETTGFISGLFLDFISSGPFGVNILLRTIIGYIGGCFNKVLNTEGFLIPLLLGFIATIIKIFLIWIISILFPNSVLPYHLISWGTIFEIVINSLLTPFLFMFLRLFKSTLIVAPEKLN